VIKGFKDRAAERLWMGETVKRYAAFQKQALRRLDALNAAASLTDLQAIRGNRLEALKGDRKGQHSIRINDQWRLCFVWTPAGPKDVEIADYH